MSIKRKLTAIGASVAVLALAQVSFAQSTALSKKVDLSLRDGELLHALSALTLQTGIEFVIGTTDQEFNRINLALRGETAADALRYICEAAGAYVEEDQNGIFIIRSGTPTKEIEPAVTHEVEKPVVLRKIRLMKADPAAVYMQIVENIVPPERWMLRGPQNAKATSITPWKGPEIRDLTSGRSNADFDERPVATATGLDGNFQDANGGISLPGDESGQFGGGGFGGGGFGGGGQGGGGFGQGGGGFGQGGGGFGQGGGGGGFGQGGGGNLSNISGGDGFVPEDIDSITYSPTDNSFVVQGTEEAIRELERLIEMFDISPQLVHIDVKFITTSDSLDKSFGMDWLYQRGTMFAGNRTGTFARTNDPIFINYATGNIQTRLRTLLAEGWGRVVNNPSVTTMNNQPAIFGSAVQTTVFVNQATSTAGGIIITPQPQSVSAQSNLQVRPRINGDGTVTMGLSPQIQEFGQLRRGPDGSEIPDVLSQFISVVVKVKSGETVALGGLTRKLDNSSRSRIPILSDLPIIGQLFQGRNSQRTTQELTIFVTPTILEEDEYGGIRP